MSLETSEAIHIDPCTLIATPIEGPVASWLNTPGQAHPDGSRGSEMLWFSDERDGAEVSAQPVAAPVEWRINQSPQSDRHLMAVLSNGAVRSTSAIASVLSEPLEVITSSGRMCRFTQAPAKDPDVRLKLLGRAIRIGLSEFSDVSEQFLIELGNAPDGSCSDAPIGSREAQQEECNMPQAPGAPT